MKHILFIAPYPHANAPSQRFRFEHFLPILKEYNYKYTFHSFLDENTWSVLYQSGKSLQKVKGIFQGFLRRFLLLFQLTKFDLVFIHREASPIGPPIFEFLIAKIWRKKIIYDFDDAIWLPNTSQENSIAAALKWNKKVKSICKWTWKVSCGNEYLATYARKYNTQVEVIPTVVNTQEQHYPRKQTRQKDKVVLGWTGSHSTLVYLKTLISVFQSLEKELGDQIEVLVIANKNPELPLKNFRFLKWNKETEIEDLSKLDIGVMPLSNTQWTKGKCGFKAIQYMALNIPALVSPVSVNTKIVTDNVDGFHCNTEEEWKINLLDLINNEAKRKRMGILARQKIIQNYSVQALTEDFLGLFKEV